MSETTASTSGDASATSGAEGQANAQVESTSGDETSVPKSHAEKILKESKNKSARIAELEAQLKGLEEAKLEEQQQWQTIAEKRGQELEQLKSKVELHDKTVEKARKVAAVKTHLVKMGLRPEQEELALNKLLDVNDLVVDPDTGAVLGAEEKAKLFRQEYGGLGIFGSQVPGVNQNAPVGTHKPKSANEMSKEEIMAQLRALPKSS